MTEERLIQLASQAIDGTLTTGEAAELSLFIDTSETNKATFEEIKLILTLGAAATAAVEPSTDVAWENLSAVIFAEQSGGDKPTIPLQVAKHRSRYWLVAAAIALLAIVGAGLFFKSQTATGSNQVFVAALGEIKSFDLSDGTKVQLNGGSEIEVSSEFNQRARQLKLKGEAYFEVAKDAKRPFIVAAGPTTAEALGTEFNLRKDPYSETVQLSVVEGKVRFRDTIAGQELILIANQVAEYHPRTGKLTLETLRNPEEEAGWVNHILIFRDVEFPQAIARIESQYGVKIHFPDHLKTARITANFDRKALPQVLDVIESIYGLKSSQNADVVTLSE